MGAKGGENMESRKLLDVLHTAERLKDATRHCDTSCGRRESVAEHSWRMTLMAYLVMENKPFLIAAHPLFLLLPCALLTPRGKPLNVVCPPDKE